MRQPKLVTWVNTLVAVVICGVVVSGIWYVSTHRIGYFRKEVRSAFSTQYQAVAEQYKRRIGDYEGMCAELAPVEGVSCQSTSEYYRIFAKQRNEKYLCVDSTRFEGLVESIPTRIALCQ